MKKDNRGGARKNAGRKKGIAKKMIWISVPADKYDELKLKVANYVARLIKPKNYDK